MDDKALCFDRKTHLLYSKAVKAVMLKHLNTHHSAEEAQARWEKIQKQYAAFLKDLPNLGGKACTHNGAGGTYDCIALFAYYEIEKAPMDELYAMNCAVLLPPFKRMGHLVNMNFPGLLRVSGFASSQCAKKDRKLEASCPTGYIMHVEPYDKRLGVRYQFTRCPIAEFAKAHGYTHLMPAFCNADYPALGAMHAALIRKNTCANADICDYWIVGDQSPHLKVHPQYVDEAGYIRNR